MTAVRIKFTAFEGMYPGVAVGYLELSRKEGPEGKLRDLHVFQSHTFMKASSKGRSNRPCKSSVSQLLCPYGTRDYSFFRGFNILAYWSGALDVHDSAPLLSLFGSPCTVPNIWCMSVLLRCGIVG